jgi:hypothetical protein
MFKSAERKERKAFSDIISGLGDVRATERFTVQLFTIGGQTMTVYGMTREELDKLQILYANKKKRGIYYYVLNKKETQIDLSMVTSIHAEYEEN